MTHEEVVANISRQTGVPAHQVDAVLTALGDLIYEGIQHSPPITIRGLGSFMAKLLPWTHKYNPQTGRIELVQPKVPYFAPGR
jgi:nucleoid DNA-binding protein